MEAGYSDHCLDSVGQELAGFPCFPDIEGSAGGCCAGRAEGDSPWYCVGVQCLGANYFAPGTADSAQESALSSKTWKSELHVKDSRQCTPVLSCAGAFYLEIFHAVGLCVALTYGHHLVDVPSCSHRNPDLT